MGGDMFRCLGIRVDNRWGTGIVAIHRGRNQRSFDPEAIKSLDRFAPSLRRMLAVRGRLAATDRRMESVEAMLDRVGQAALLVRADGWNGRASGRERGVQYVVICVVAVSLKKKKKKKI